VQEIVWEMKKKEEDFLDDDTVRHYNYTIEELWVVMVNHQHHKLVLDDTHLEKMMMIDSVH
jgi:uncharacterized Tic20 family protein